MNWTELLKVETEHNYKVAEGLLDLVDNDRLDWKPSTGSNWMTTGQLIFHIVSACGAGFKGFVTGDWGFQPGTDADAIPPEEMLLPAEKLPKIGSIAEAKKLLREDRLLALDMLGKCSEKDLAEKIAPAPWDQEKTVLGHRLLQMVEHLGSHKSQLFYYLKLQGKPVHTGHLWGM
ncbi:DinB family protein [bacterium]|nr:DinB family protein [bacterium]